MVTFWWDKCVSNWTSSKYLHCYCNRFSCGLTVSTSATDESAIGANDGSATATPSGGTSPYTYAWSPSGGSSATESGLTAGTYTVTVTDANGCIVSDDATVGSGPNAISTVDAIALRVYPNPTNENLNIVSNESVKYISVIGMEGKIHFNQLVNSSNFSINVSNLSTGMYLYRLETESGKVVRETFIKQ